MAVKITIECDTQAELDQVFGRLGRVVPEVPLPGPETAKEDPPGRDPTSCTGGACERAWHPHVGADAASGFGFSRST